MATLCPCLLHSSNLTSAPVQLSDRLPNLAARPQVGSYEEAMTLWVPTQATSSHSRYSKVRVRISGQIKGQITTALWRILLI